MNIKLESFEGPLQLLHYQLKKNKISIYDINISKIADQYLDLVQSMDTSLSNSMDSKSEFILLAAELIAIKTKMLLREPEEDDTDPIQDLAQRLEIYETFANVANTLKDMQKYDIYYRKDAEIIAKPVLEIHTSVASLFDIFNATLNRTELKDTPPPIITLESEEYSLVERVSRLQNILRIKNNLSFTELLKSTKTTAEKIITFLALLELIKEKKVIAEQKGDFGEIMLKYET
jgi:segregation and condensation protein A